MLDGVNDDPDQARRPQRGAQAPRGLQGQPDPLQPDPGRVHRQLTRGDRAPSATPSSTSGIPTTIRLTRGRDIQAACGQLAAAADGSAPRGSASTSVATASTGARGQSLSSMLVITWGSTGRSPGPVSVPSIASTASIPETTRPKTVCLPSSQGAASIGDDEELGAVGVRAGVRHREGAALDLVLVELVLERVAGAAGSGALRAAALDHEVRDHPVEAEVVVEALGGELAEVLDRLRRILVVELELDRAGIGVHGGCDMGGTLVASSGRDFSGSWHVASSRTQ